MEGLPALAAEKIARNWYHMQPQGERTKAEFFLRLSRDLLELLQGLAVDWQNLTFWWVCQIAEH